MAILLRYLGVLLALLGALGAPVATFYGLGAYRLWVRSSAGLEQARQARASEEARRERLAAYEDYAKQTARFLAAAQNNATVGSAWNSYHVDIKNQEFDISQLYSLLDNARNGNGYYFRPHQLDVISVSGLDKLEGLPEQVTKLKDKKTARGNLSLVSVQGDYLVLNRE